MSSAASAAAAAAAAGADGARQPPAPVTHAGRVTRAKKRALTEAGVADDDDADGVDDSADAGAAGPKRRHRRVLADARLEPAKMTMAALDEELKGAGVIKSPPRKPERVFAVERLRRLRAEGVEPEEGAYEDARPGGAGAVTGPFTGTRFFFPSDVLLYQSMRRLRQGGAETFTPSRPGEEQREEVTHVCQPLSSSTLVNFLARDGQRADDGARPLVSLDTLPVNLQLAVDRLLPIVAVRPEYGRTGAWYDQPVFLSDLTRAVTAAEARLAALLAKLGPDNRGRIEDRRMANNPRVRERLEALLPQAEGLAWARQQDIETTEIYLAEAQQDRARLAAKLLKRGGDTPRTRQQLKEFECRIETYTSELAGLRGG